ncbi:MAG: helix-turn-helix transcriptional regulator [Lachnospiraceae bacterium]|nr:helix-turn-helix transcriptional regulator [Lachnospiraceae bacterium]
MTKSFPVIDMTGTGRNITQLREAAGMTVKDLQKIFGFATPQAIYKWQHGAALPTIDNLLVLSAAFGVAIDDIIVVNIRQIAS